MRHFLLIVLFVASGLTASAQKSIADTSISFFAITGEIGLQNPFGDIADRFGYGGITGGGVFYKFKNNLTLEGNFGFFFGNIIKEDTILKPLMTENGLIIGRDGNPADVFLFERGFLITGRVGKIFPIIGPNPNSGLHVALGGGFMQHKIRIQDNFGSVPQLDGPYKAGYDRLTFGLTASQSVGYQQFSDYRLFNFYVGAEVYEGFTKNRRSFNFDTGLPDNRQRVDILATLVVRWYFPIYRRQPKEFYFY